MCQREFTCSTPDEEEEEEEEEEERENFKMVLKTSFMMEDTWYLKHDNNESYETNEFKT